ncbi:putative metallo-hydrolase YflN [Oxobacter pfennigii]|uniref:Putative metallo-hydrolase YflN n=1 Tax=Oxobacter pfennigii TaxID=36849 RepID=A0A0P8WCU9_9CLOT|nr:MBL fold metallo-hydrolase [Oxobacter pfennigii]KPU45671.1 putative metallo-hydrolase YflN [Oxobacter pfennigii]
MKIADGLEMLQLKAPHEDAPNFFNLTLLWDEDTAVLFDAGLPGQLKDIKDLIEKTGVSFGRLSKIFITHQDGDHIGSLKDIKDELGGKVETMSHGEERPYIEGDKMPIKMTLQRIAQIEAEINVLPEEEREKERAMYYIKGKIDCEVYDGQEFIICGGIKVIHTPGHTPGHICLYLKKYKALVTGDALNVVDGKLYGPNPIYTYDMEKALNSLKKLSDYDIQTVICYHGGIYNNNANQRIAELIQGEDVWVK